jgi:hypothetical protein
VFLRGPINELGINADKAAVKIEKLNIKINYPFNAFKGQTDLIK